MRARFTDAHLINIVEQHALHTMEHGPKFDYNDAMQDVEIIAAVDGAAEYTAHEWRRLCKRFLSMSEQAVHECRQIVAAESMTDRTNRRRDFLKGF